MVKIFALTNLGIRLRTAWEVRDDYVAVRLFKLCATCKGLAYHESELLYGEALIYGTGGMKRDIPEGMKLLHRSAFGGMGPVAYFVIGSIYEQGIGDGSDGIDKNLSTARLFYEVAVKSTEDEWWDPKIDTVHVFLRTPEWHALASELSSNLGERFNWALAAQAFLFGTAVGLSAIVQPQHFSPFLIILPLLGILLAVFAIAQILETMLRNSIRGKAFCKMLKFKLQAYCGILEKIGDPFCQFCGTTMKHSNGKKQKLVHFFCFCCPKAIFRCLSSSRGGNTGELAEGSMRPSASPRSSAWTFARRSQDKRQFRLRWCVCHLFLCSVPSDIELEHERRRYGEVYRNTIFLRYLTPTVRFLSLILACAFLAAWIVMLVNEIASFPECSDWWHSTCQGSDTCCNYETTARALCNLTLGEC